MKTLKNIFVFLVICSMTAVLYLGMKTELSPEKINYGTVIAEGGNWYLFWHFLDFRFR